MIFSRWTGWSATVIGVRAARLMLAVIVVLGMVTLSACARLGLGGLGITWPGQPLSRFDGASTLGQVMAAVVDVDTVLAVGTRWGRGRASWSIRRVWC